jgi:hypothetical protein
MYVISSIIFMVTCIDYCISMNYIFIQGIWHRVECEEDSISINVSLIVSSYAEIFCSGLQQLLWENPAFRGTYIALS